MRFELLFWCLSVSLLATLFTKFFASIFFVAVA